MPLYRPLSTLHDHRCRWPCKTRFRLADYASTGRGSNPLDCDERFLICGSPPFCSHPPFRGLLDASWAHARRKLHEIFDRDGSEIAAEGLRRIAEFYEIEAEIRGFGPGQRMSAREERTAQMIKDFRIWLAEVRSRVSAKSRLGEKLGYIHRHWNGLQTFLTDGRVEIDSNAVENLVRPIALNRKNALFAGHDEGGRAWGRIASLIETAKINGVEPFAYIKATLEAIACDHPNNRIDELLPWNFASASS